MYKTDTRVLKLESIERRLELALRDLRLIRADLAEESRSKGILGSRGMTQFVLDLIRHNDTGTGYSIRDLLQLADEAGYRVPTARTLSKRLTERSYRVGDIRFDTVNSRWMARQG